MANNSRTKNSVLNILFLLVLQLVSVVSGLILPRLMIGTFGSEANGLVSSITQFLSFITLLEAGVGSVVRSSLYKPLAERNFDKVSGIVKASKQFYLRLAFYFVIYALGLCIIYPNVTKTSFDLTYVVTMILILSISNVVEYLIGYSNSILIKADQKSRIIDIINAIALVVNIGAVYLLVYLGCSIHIVKLLSCVIFAFKPIAYWLYVKTHYKLNQNALADDKSLTQKNSGMVHNVAYFLHTNVDVFLITLFMGTSSVSIYVVYYAIASGITKIAVSLCQGSTSSIGNLIAKESRNDQNKFFDKFEFIQTSLATVLFTVTAIMIIPFVTLYSDGFTDANYIQPLFAYALVLAEAIYCIRCIYSTVSSVANKFKETRLGAILEAGVNFAVSIALIHWLGLFGIAIGTLCGMLTRAIFDALYTSRHVLNRPILRTLKCLGVNVLVASLSILICHFIPEFNVGGWLGWVARSVMTTAITSVVAISAYLIFYYKLIKEILSRIKKKKRGQTNG